MSVTKRTTYLRKRWPRRPWDGRVAPLSVPALASVPTMAVPELTASPPPLTACLANYAVHWLRLDVATRHRAPVWRFPSRLSIPEPTQRTCVLTGGTGRPAGGGATA